MKRDLVGGLRHHESRDELRVASRKMESDDGSAALAHDGCGRGVQLTKEGDGVVDVIAQATS